MSALERDAAAERARSVVRRLRARGHEALFAGGCVRDRLRGEHPSDYDVATDASAEQVQQLFEQTVPIGVQFGVVLVLIDGHAVEVASFRTDAEYVDGRHPVAVRPASAEEDAQRRDFTINGMFLDPETDEVIDYVGGREDLENGIVRAIGDAAERFREDRLRLLRAVRFAARFGFEIEARTAAAIRANATSVIGIAWERIGDEIVRILTEGQARRGFELLDELGLLDVVLPEVAAMKGVEQSPDYHPEGDVFEHTLRLLDNLGRSKETLALGALLHDVSKRECAGRKGSRITFYGHTEVGEKKAIEICKRLRRSREVWESVGYLVRNHLRHVEAPRMRRSTLKRFLSEAGIDELLELTRLDGLASNKDLTAYEFCITQRELIGEEELRPEPLLRGRDLLDLGFRPGPQVGRILAAVEERQLEGELTTSEDALSWVRSEFEPENDG
jgi:poly(A) polymerase